MIIKTPNGKKLVTNDQFSKLTQLGFTGVGSTAVGSAAGGALGAGLALRSYLKQRRELLNRLAECTTDECRTVMEARLDQIKGHAVLKGIVSTGAGAVGGGLAGGVGSYYGYIKPRAQAVIDDVNNGPTITT